MENIGKENRFKDLFKWYDFPSSADILVVQADENDCYEVLDAKTKRMDIKSLEVSLCNEKFDYIICVQALELSSNPDSLLKSMKNMLKPNGRIFLGMNNRLGVRYFCGDRDIYTNRPCDGVNNYHVYDRETDCMTEMEGMRGRCYSRAEITSMVKRIGEMKHKFYSVYPDLTRPQLIFADDYLPNENLLGRYFPVYNDPDTLFIEEENLINDLIDNGMFHLMANAYLIEIVMDESFSEMLHVTNTLDRGERKNVCTVITKDKVRKYAESIEGADRLKGLVSNMEYLKAQGLKVIDMTWKNGMVEMPYVEAETAQVYLEKLLRHDKKKFLVELDRFVDIVSNSSTTIKNPASIEGSVVLERGYPDLVPLNCLYHDNEFYFYDQEYFFEKYPLKAILERIISTLYFRNVEMEKLLPADELRRRYGIENKMVWQPYDWEYVNGLRDIDNANEYHDWRGVDYATLETNRKYMSYPLQGERRRFINIFKDIDKRRLVIFGCGVYAKRFFSLYNCLPNVSCIVDNDKKKWGDYQGIPVLSPLMLQFVDRESVHIIICIKQYQEIESYLKTLGLNHYSIYDPEKINYFL